MSSRREQAEQGWWSAWPILMGVSFFYLFAVVGQNLMDNYQVDLGSPLVPPQRQMYFMASYYFFSTLAASFLALGIARLASLEHRAERFAHWWAGTSDRSWLGVGTLLAIGIPVLIRRFVLHDAPLTDDESAYHFASQLLASGRLYTQSPPMKLFFDRAFMVNDGKFYAQYFLGWPALMVPGIWLGLAGYMNALYSGLTLPGIFFVLRRMLGSTWAKVGVVLYLCSPMLMTGAATEMSHTTCMMSLVWMTWCALRSRDADAPWWSHAGVPFLMSLAFFIRPTSAIGIGLPMLSFWLYSLWRQPPGRRFLTLLKAAPPAVAMGVLFLLVNKIQNGSPFVTAYAREFAYSAENHYRFSHWRAEFITKVAHFKFEDPIPLVAARTGIALMRLNLTMFGWPFSLALMCFARARHHGWLLWTTFFGYLAVHFFIFEPGIDSFGVAHYSELAWPILALSVVGLRELTDLFGVFAAAVNAFGKEIRRLYLAYLPAGALLALLLCCLMAYLPVSFGALLRMSAGINAPKDAAAQENIHQAIVFSPKIYTRPCSSRPSHHFVFWRPNPDPDLRDDILWVNHITVDEDKKLMALFPGRKGYVMQWVLGCNAVFLPIEKMESDAVPNAYGF